MSHRILAGEMSAERAGSDPAPTQAFAERVLAMLNDAAAVLMMSLGHRTGLFDTMARLPASTSHAIAASAGLNERYVREWLAAMTVARVVEYDARSGSYRLPAEHAAVLTRASSPDNLAVTAQMVPMLAQVEDGIVACFAEGGGLRYEDYPGFHRVMAEDSAQTVVEPLIDVVLPLVPGLVHRLEQGIRVLDVGCGRGKALIKMAAHFPASRFHGFDLGRDAIAGAAAEARALGLDNLCFEARDVTDLDAVACYDFITTFDAVHDQKHPARVLRAIARALAPDGVYLMQDIAGSSRLENNLDHPVATVLYTVSCMHCMSVSLGQGGDGLGTMWGEDTARRMLEEAGFRDIEIEHLPHDFMNVWFVCRAS